MFRLSVCAFSLAVACTTSGNTKDKEPSADPEPPGAVLPATFTDDMPDAGVADAGSGSAMGSGSDCGSLCGNGVIDPGEQCDDGSANGTPGDDCSATCQCLD
jgi:cysteine-rich repeat protein